MRGAVLKEQNKQDLEMLALQKSMAKLGNVYG